MAKTPAQINQMIRDAQRRQQRAIDDYNRKVNQHNKQVVDNYNREVRRVNQHNKQVVDNYNREVRAHNSRVRANQQRLRSELAKLSRQPATVRYTVYQTSVQTLHRSYERLDQHAETRVSNPAYDRLVDFSEREVANSLSVTNALLGDEGVEEALDTLEDAALTDELRKISPELDNRWRGAVYSLSPRNPDAARHFCTSAREIITEILEVKAPNREVLAVFPNEIVSRERPIPTRRAKIKFFFQRKGLADDALEDFVNEDVSNILELFDVFNKGTHGSAGRFDLPQLTKIKKRVEDGIMFLAQIVG